jgi:hypothetical protein
MILGLASGYYSLSNRDSNPSAERTRCTVLGQRFAIATSPLIERTAVDLGPVGQRTQWDFDFFVLGRFLTLHTVAIGLSLEKDGPLFPPLRTIVSAIDKTGQHESCVCPPKWTRESL